MSFTFVDSGEDAHPKAQNGLQAGLSIEQGVEPVENKGAQCEADKHGGEDVADHVASSLTGGQKVNGACCNVPFAGCRLTVDNDALDFNNALNIRMVINRIRGELKTMMAAALARGGDSEVSGV
jgi:hypothetical protein